ncbi:hypothetical protein H010_14026 [Hydrogenophaga taeniospiralis CCUG 15921]|uniref:Uncharacterized protein n=1 Tax=Hydrogenophaga taeniospiralis CCUG 15921 TaxID=1281780 RepID=A0A9X4NTH4_9BURK|nr:hypothetical protein [Hydrogenophaga taeniospiralis CCUG 15921]
MGRNARSEWGRSGRAQVGRIKQQGVVANDATGSPVGFQNHVHERFVHRAAAGQPQEGTTVWSPFQTDAQVAQGGIELHARGAKSVARGQTDPQAGRLFGGDFRHINFGSQGFPKGRLHHDAAQRQRLGVAMLRQADAQHRRRCNRM